MAIPYSTRFARLVGGNAVAIWLLTAALCSAQPLFGFYDSPISSPFDRSRMQQDASHSNVTFRVRWWVEDDWQQAQAAGLCVILPWPDEFWTGDTIAPAVDWTSALRWDRPMWYGFPGSTAVDWYYAVLWHRTQVCGFKLADEPDCNYGVTFPRWTASSCEAMARKLEANAGSIKTIFGIHGWNPPVLVNYTPAFVNGLRANLPGYRLPYWVDWFGFAAYTPWGQCFGNVTCPQLLAGLKAKMRPDQRLVLFPRAFSGSFLGYAPTDFDVAVGGYTYLAYLLSDPQVAGLFPFIEWSGPWGIGGASVPMINETFRAIGRIVTGRQ